VRFGDPGHGRADSGEVVFYALPALGVNADSGSLLCQDAAGCGVLGWRLAGPGSDLSEELVWGCEPAALESETFPVSSRARPRTGDEVVEHGLVDEVGEPALQAAHGLFGFFPAAALRS
jgi:hypothetical protein